MIERSRLFLIIALGETILTTGTALSGVSIDVWTVLAGGLAVLGTVALWGLYFAGSDRLVSEHATSTGDPLRARLMSSQQVIDLSSTKWRWMSERNVEALAGLFHRDAVFVHMGATFARDQELEIICSGGIVYQKASIESVSVPLLTDHTAIVLTTMELLAVVGGNEVTNPFVVTEVYVHEGADWSLASMSFTKLLTG